MSAKTIFTFVLFITLFCACKNDASGDNEKSEYNPREEPLPKTGDNVSEASKSAQLTVLINESKKTLDSIDIAYRDIMQMRKQQSLNLYEKEQVNQALMELNDAKDLIVLETEKAVISELKEKSASLQIVMQKMNTASEKMQRIAQTLSRVSGIIEKTTNILATALTSGLVRPPITPSTRS
jgi:hypothetical protein